MPKVGRSPEGRVKAFALQETSKIKLDYTRLLPRALRAIRSANVRFGILPPQSGLRWSARRQRGRGFARAVGVADHGSSGHGCLG